MPFDDSGRMRRGERRCDSAVGKELASDVEAGGPGSSRGKGGGEEGRESVGGGEICQLFRSFVAGEQIFSFCSEGSKLPGPNIRRAEVFTRSEEVGRALGKEEEKGGRSVQLPFSFSSLASSPLFSHFLTPFPDSRTS